MKTAYFFLLAILALPFVSAALNFTISAPEEVKINQEFKVGINSDTDDIYDVKIFVHEQGNFSNIISEIYNSGWKNPYWFIKESYPKETAYTIKVTSFPGEQELCARLRESTKTTFTQKCMNLTIINSTSQVENKTNQETNTTIKKTNETNQSKIQTLDNQTNQNNTTLQEQDNLPKNTQQDTEIIFLNSQNPKTFTTPTEQKRLLIIYSFTIFCIIIIILLVLRKL